MNRPENADSPGSERIDLDARRDIQKGDRRPIRADQGMELATVNDSRAWLDETDRALGPCVRSVDRGEPFPYALNLEVAATARGQSGLDRPSGLGGLLVPSNTREAVAKGFLHGQIVTGTLQERLVSGPDSIE